MIILAIETSCDDTGVALVKKDEKGNISLLSGALSSQDEIHRKWGGVYPSEAKRAHQKNLVPTLEEALKKADFIDGKGSEMPKKAMSFLEREEELAENLSSFLRKSRPKKIDAVAVTIGPGLEPCLYAGVNFAKALAASLEVPLIPVNHIKAHILSFLFEKREVSFPAVALVASGGHTELVLMKFLKSYNLLGKTRDDAAGECLDKTARVLGLGYPGGPAIAKKAAKLSTPTTRFSISLPRPMLYSKNYDFSFSGLKTAVLYDFLSRKKETQKSEDYITAMAREIEEAVTDVLVFKLKKALTDTNAKTAILGGGVTANKTLQQKAEKLVSSFPGTELIIPSPRLSTDNAEMIGAAATVEKKKTNYVTIVPNANLTVY